MPHVLSSFPYVLSLVSHVLSRFFGAQVNVQVSVPSISKKLLMPNGAKEDEVLRFFTL